jgi:hypothetical protein
VQKPGQFAVSEPQSVEDWLALVRRNCAAAQELLKKNMTAEAWYHAGFAIEAAVKAAIMVYHRFNTWPSRGLRQDLYEHKLHSLLQEAGIDVKQLTKDPVAHKLQTVLLWNRGDTYNPKAMPRRVAASMVEAACGSDGVRSWIGARFRLDI